MPSGDEGGGKELPALARLYGNDKSLKYSGAEDNFNPKLKIFYEKCDMAGVKPAIFAKAFNMMLTGTAEEFYYLAISPRVSGIAYTFVEMATLVKNNFETEARRQRKWQEWMNTKLSKVIQENEGISMAECLEKLIARLQNLRHRLPTAYQTDEQMRSRLLLACQETPECSTACFRPSNTLQAVCQDLRSCVGTADSQRGNTGIFYTNRIYHRPNNNRNGHTHGGGYDNRNDNTDDDNPQDDKKCICCRRIGCWSTRHSKADQKRAWDTIKKSKRKDGKPWTNQRIQQCFIDYEGVPPSLEDEVNTWLQGYNPVDQEDAQESEVQKGDKESFVTHFGPCEGAEIHALLQSQITAHALTATSNSTEYKDSATYSMSSRYDTIRFFKE